MVAGNTAFCSVGIKSNQKAFIYLNTTYVMIAPVGASTWAVWKHNLEVPHRIGFLMVWGEHLQLNCSLISWCPETKVPCIFSNKILTLTSGGQQQLCNV